MFFFFILVAGLLIILIGFMIFLKPFLDVKNVYVNSLFPWVTVL